MGRCIICGAAVDGRVCDTHEEDVVFEFRGSRPGQLVPGRYYEGRVDGYADFGVFVDVGDHVTGLLHQSELDSRLDSLEFDPGDTIYVQVLQVRDNGNVDLGWSIRQREADFRGTIVHDPGADEPERLPDEEDEEDDEAVTNGGGAAVQPDPSPVESGGAAGSTEADSGEGDSAGGSETGGAGEATVAGETVTAEGSTTEATADEAGDEASAAAAAVGSNGEAAAVEESPAEAEPPERVAVESLSERVGDRVTLEGEVVGVRQTGGPTVFEVRDESAAVDVAAFVGAGERAYPEIETDDVVRVVGEVELRRDELQVESEAVEALEGEDAEDVRDRLAVALADAARPDDLELLGGHEPVAGAEESLLDAAEAVRRAVLETRPVIVRHAATADGYAAGAAIERAVLPLVREEHARGDAEYHFFDRRPLEDPVYGMDDATNDLTDMLEGQDRHDEKLPLVVVADAGTAAESAEALEFLGVYGVEALLVADATVDPAVAEQASTVVAPVSDEEPLPTTTALAANLAAAVNPEVRGELHHLPAVSYWEDPPEAYVELAREAGYDETAVRERREAVALSAFYQTYEDKRELVADLLFDAAPAEGDAPGLAAHVAEQFREKLDAALGTARENAEVREEGGVRFTVLDADAYAHPYDFPPASLLADALHRAERDDREGGDQLTVLVTADELHLRSDPTIDLRETVPSVREAVPDAGVRAVGGREGRLTFLAGRREAVLEATLRTVAADLV